MIFTIVIMVVVTVAVASFLLAPKMVARRVVYDLVPDAPCPFGYKMAWIALKTGDTAEVVATLGLYQVEPANWRSGIGTIYDEALGENRVFVSPPVEGWTFVAGLALPHPLGDRFVDKFTAMMEDLAAQYTEVQYFFSYPLIDFYAWARGGKGRIARSFAISDEGIILKTGRITKDEKSLGLKLFELRGVRGLSGDAGGELVLYPTETHVMELAGKWGLDPTKLDQYESEPGLGFVGFAPIYWRPERLRKAA